MRTLSLIRPPITIISPSAAKMVLLSVRLLVIRSFSAVLGAISELSCSTSRRRLRPSLMCGRTFRLIPMSLRSTVVKGFSEPLPGVT
ncbi:hypothetical protein D3C77_721740 [compost metagenome]